MAALSLAQIREETRQIIGSGAFDRFFLPGGLTTWVDEAANWACEQSAALLGLTRTDSLVTVASKLAVIPTDAIKVVEVIGRIGTMGKVLYQSTMQIEDQKSPNWKSRITEPTAWVEKDGSTILLNGVPASGGILVGYIQRPTPMASDVDTPDSRIPEVFHQYLKYAAATYLLMLTGQGHNPDKAGKFFLSFTTGLGLGSIPLTSVSVQR